MQVYSYTYSFPYLALLFVLVFLYLNEAHYIKAVSTKTAQKCSLMLLICFFGLRGHLNTDFISYYPFFQHLPTLWDVEKIGSNRYEIGFVLYSSFIKSLFPNYFAWVFVNTVIDLSILFAIFKRYSPSIVLSLIVFFSFYGIVIETNLYRNSKAIMLFLLSLSYLQERRFLPYLLLNILGCLFHLSSLIYIPLYFVLNKEIPRSCIWGGFLFANVAFYLNIGFSTQLDGLLSVIDRFLSLNLLDKSVEWQNDVDMGMAYGFSIGYLERTFSFIIFSLFYNRMKAKSRYVVPFYNSFFLYYVLFHLLSPISSEIMMRIAYLFCFSYWLLYPTLCATVHKKYIICFLILLCTMKIAQDGRLRNMEYQNCLFGNCDTYSERKRIAIETVLKTQSGKK